MKPALSQRSRDLHEERPLSHSHLRSRVYRAFHVLDDVAHWYLHRDCEQSLLFEGNRTLTAEMITARRLFGVTWAGAMSIRHAVSSPPLWLSRGSAGLFFSRCSASLSPIRSSIAHGRTQCMGTCIPAIVLCLHKNIAGLEAPILLGTVLLCYILYISEFYCKSSCIYIPLRVDTVDCR